MVPFLITRIPFKLRGSSWIGTVENVEVKETVVPYLKGSLHHFYNRWFDNHIVLTVKTDDGNVLKHEAFQGNARFREFIDYYKEGDRVIYIYGTNYVYKKPRKQDDTLICVICGGLNIQDNDKCVFCGHSLYLPDVI